MMILKNVAKKCGDFSNICDVVTSFTLLDTIFESSR